MLIGRNRGQRQNAAELQVDEYSFEEVDDFKYLGTNLRSTKDNHKKNKKPHHIREEMPLRLLRVIGIEATVQEIKRTTIHSTIVWPPRERYSLAHPNERAPHSMVYSPPSIRPITTRRSLIN